MQIEARGVDVFAAMGEFHGDVRFVRTLVGRKARIAVNAEQRSAGRARIGDQIRRDVVEDCREICDEPNGWLVCMSFVFIFVRLKPLAIVVALEALEEVEEVGSEVGRHGKQGTRSWREK